ncbi:hypothetical protein BC835DRAFT_433981 [Cytidiella melzeri]|nr:hypothetical protein BC835DRAFT_951000 [Cytidiella melzeri]KAI0686820.1 hypothetical protein BC835DRAFT_433981 [Cytidiella melzeri]
MKLHAASQRPAQEKTPILVRRCIKECEIKPAGGRAGTELVLRMHVPPEQRATSIAWLIQPAWMDGAFDPPVCYTSLEEIHRAREAGLRRLSPDQRREVIDAIRRRQDTEAQAVSALAAPPASGNAPVVAAAAIGTSTTTTLTTTTTATSQQEPHLVIVTVSCTDPASAARPSTSKAAPKRRTDVKNASIVLTGALPLVTFSKEALTVHELDEVYSIGPVAVPPFKMHWTGLTKGSASMIEREDEFQRALDAVLKKRGATVFVEYNLDLLEGFRARKRPANIVAGRDDTLNTPGLGTKKPAVDDFSEHAQRRGEIIVQLEEMHTCAEHLGEHGQPGACAKTEAGHIRLTHWRKRIWADAYISGDATLKHPPHCPEFDGQRDGRISLAKPRGRTGPHSLAAVPSAAPADVAALLPILTTLIGQQNMMFTALMGSRNILPTSPLSGPESTSVLGRLSLPSLPTSTSMPFATPSQPSLGFTSGTNMPSTPLLTSSAMQFFSPIPARRDIIHFFLLTLLEKRNVDVLDQEELLTSCEMTPSTLSSIPIQRLMEITNLKEGPAWQLVDFARDYMERLSFKREHASPYNPDDEFCFTVA